MKKHIWMIVLIMLTTIPGYSQNARDIVEKANELIRATSSFAEVTMTVVKPDWSRSYSMKMWSLEPDYSLVLVTKPARDKGSVTLKRKKEVWNWIPSVRRTIKIPPSMMMQSWMGSDFTNDDLVRQSSIVEDYDHEIIGKEEFQDYECYKIQLTAKPEAPVVWGKILMWISVKGYLELKADHYDEDGYLIKTMVGSKVKKIGGRTIPTYWEMIPHEEEGQKTILEYHSMEFDKKMNTSFFSIQNMKRIR